MVIFKWTLKTHPQRRMNEVGYVSQQKDCRSMMHSSHVCTDSESSYGLKQAPRDVYDKLSAFPIQHTIVTPMAERPNLDEDKGGKLIDLHDFVLNFLDIVLLAGSSKKQKHYRISTTEAEYIALSGCCAQILGCDLTTEDKDLVSNKNSDCIVTIKVVLLLAALPRERFATLLPLLGVRQMSPETLKELQDESVSETRVIVCGEISILTVIAGQMDTLVADSIGEKIETPTVPTSDE
ncbi:hypothetical protein Tco_0984904 [Tanacetum coccineum]